MLKLKWKTTGKSKIHDQEIYQELHRFIIVMCIVMSDIWCTNQMIELLTQSQPSFFTTMHILSLQYFSHMVIFFFIIK